LRGASTAGGREILDEGDGFAVLSLPFRRGAARGRNERGAKIRDEQSRLAKGREVFQSRHDFGAREKRCGRGEGEGRVPMVETVARQIFRTEAGEESGRGGVEFCVELLRELRLLSGLGRELREAESDRLLDLVRKIKVVTRDVREQRINEMQSTQFVSRGGRFFFSH